MKRLILYFLFISSASFAGGKCPDNDVSKADIKNLEIHAPSEVDGPLKFKNGVAAARIDKSQKQPDWEYTIIRDELIMPAKGIVLRVLKINKNHLQGSGNLNLFTVLTCEQGLVKTHWPMTEINAINIQHDKISYETLGELRGSEPYGRGSKFNLEWDSTQKAFVSTKVK